MSSTPDTKIAVVTGSTKGIGRSIALELAAQGITVVATSRDLKRARVVANEISAMGGYALGLKFNIEEADDLNSLINATADAFGRLDVLVNNAVSHNCVLPLPSLSREQIEFAFTSNITNTFLLTQVAYPLLKASRGSVINIGSAVVNRHLLGLPLYAIIKGATAQMTKVLAAEWAADGVRVNAINPGFIRTDAFSELGMPRDLIEKSYAFYRNYHPVGKIGEPVAVGKVAAYLASAAADFITGSIIEVDGGYSIKGLPTYQGNT